MLLAEQTATAPRTINWTAAAVLLALCLTALSPWAVVPDDVVWQLWVGAQINAGFKFYVDIPELNPPLWFWIGAMSVKIAEWLRLAPVTAYFLFVSSICLAGLTLFWRFTGHLDDRHRVIWLISWTLALFGLGWLNFGQREHIFLATMIGYIALIAARSSGRDIPVPLAFATGCFAALGICFKHYFLIVPLLLEVGLLFTLGRSWRPFRPEVIAGVLSGLAYIAAVLVITPEYFSQIVPMARSAYGFYDQPLLNCLQVALPTLVAVLIVHRIGNLDRGLHGPLLLAILGFVISSFVQRKLLAYHALPATAAVGACIFASLAILAFENRTKMRAAAAPILALSISLVVPMIEHVRVSYDNAGTFWDTPKLPFAFEKGKPVALFAASRSDFTNYTLRGDAKLGHRYMVMWTLPMIANIDPTKLSAPLKEIGDKLRREVVNDMVCDPPASILIATPRSDERVIAQPFDYVGYFSADPRFAKLFANYQYVATAYALRFYKQTRDIQPGQNCRPFADVSLFKR